MVIGQIWRIFEQAYWGEIAIDPLEIKTQFAFRLQRNCKINFPFNSMKRDKDKPGIQPFMPRSGCIQQPLPPFLALTTPAQEEKWSHNGCLFILFQLIFSWHAPPWPSLQEILWRKVCVIALWGDVMVKSWPLLANVLEDRSKPLYMHTASCSWSVSLLCTSGIFPVRRGCNRIILSRGPKDAHLYATPRKFPVPHGLG